jgi:ribonuclease D
MARRMHIHPLITDSQTLADLCARLAQSPYVAVDTEFMRENSYWPELCLIQIADANEAAAIDPKAPGMDLQPLLDLMVDNEDVLKIFHAGGQDLEIVHNLTGKTPHPLFDTQVAAMALGMGEQVGYSSLVESWLVVKLDKGARFTDWARRPLDKRQIDYAIGDVTHLVKIFPKLLARLQKTGRGEWLDQEMERLGDPMSYVNDPETIWQRLRIPTRRADVLGRVKALAAWREREAQGKDLPRGRIIKDETLADIASHPPRTQADLAKVRGLSAGWANNEIGRRLMAVLEKAQPLTDEEMPPREDRKPGLGKEGALVADLLKLLLKIRAKEADVAPKLIARSDDLELLAAGRREGIPFLTGWRFDQFGRDALDLVEGRMAFAVKGGKLKMTRTVDEDEA